MNINKYFLGVIIGLAFTTSSLVNVEAKSVEDKSRDVEIQENIVFNDIKSNNIDYLYSKGIVKGYNGLFMPDKKLKRINMVSMISRSLDVSEVDEFKDLIFLDVNEDNNWCLGYLYNLNIINGYNNKFLPNDVALYKHVAKVIYKTYYITNRDIDYDNIVYEDFINKKFNTNYSSKHEFTREEFSDLLYNVLKDIDFYGDVKAEKIQIENLEKEKLEAKSLENESLEKEKLEVERLEYERIVKLETERLEYELKVKLELERLELERLELERLELERLETERLEFERLEFERLEFERLEKEKLEAERLENERKAKLEYERLEREKLFNINKHDFNSYFEKVEWIDRNGIISLSIYPVLDSALIISDENYSLHKNKSFDILNDLYSSDEKWMDNTNSLFEQYKCHVDFAGSSKVPWNIEPERPYMTGLALIFSKCNPAIPESDI